MLLANISVAKKIFEEFPQCACLRRHPTPSPSSYEPVIKAALAKVDRRPSNFYLFFIFFIFMQVARHTRPEGHFKVWATIIYFPRGRCHLLLGLKQGYPFYSPYGWVSSVRSLLGRTESTTSPILQSKCHDRDSNPHSADQTPELESGALNRSAMTRHKGGVKLQNTLVALERIT